MVVTFEIKDITQLVGQKQVDVKVTGLSADGSEMQFVSDLTKCVQDYSQNYKSKESQHIARLAAREVRNKEAAR